MSPVRASILVTAVLAVCLSGPVRAQEADRAPVTKVDVSQLGPQVGETVPDFRLQDQNGTPQTLQSIMGPQGAMLVFVRSADW